MTMAAKQLRGHTFRPSSACNPLRTAPCIVVRGRCSSSWDVCRRYTSKNFRKQIIKEGVTHSSSGSRVNSRQFGEHCCCTPTFLRWVTYRVGLEDTDRHSARLPPLDPWRASSVAFTTTYSFPSIERFSKLVNIGTSFAGGSYLFQVQPFSVWIRSERAVLL